mmetsp:Transcript_44166/g.77893  ORF Transcript_44166/g.77893 Transcript_44166/m.77893 type:complete len:409 (+) Transcript_44166:152-1378(+)
MGPGSPSGLMLNKRSVARHHRQVSGLPSWSSRTRPSTCAAVHERRGTPRRRPDHRRRPHRPAQGRQRYAAQHNRNIKSPPSDAQRLRDLGDPPHRDQATPEGRNLRALSRQSSAAMRRRHHSSPSSPSPLSPSEIEVQQSPLSPQLPTPLDGSKPFGMDLATYRSIRDQLASAFLAGFDAGYLQAINQTAGIPSAKPPPASTSSWTYSTTGDSLSPQRFASPAAQQRSPSHLRRLKRRACERRTRRLVAFARLFYSPSVRQWINKVRMQCATSLAGPLVGKCISTALSQYEAAFRVVNGLWKPRPVIRDRRHAACIIQRAARSRIAHLLLCMRQLPFDIFKCPHCRSETESGVCYPSICPNCYSIPCHQGCARGFCYRHPHMRRLLSSVKRYRNLTGRQSSLLLKWRW